MDLINYKLSNCDEDVLIVRGQLNEHIVWPRYHVLITSIYQREGLQHPFTASPTSASKILEDILGVKSGLEETERCKYKLEIFTKAVDVIND